MPKDKDRKDKKDSFLSVIHTSFTKRITFFITVFIAVLLVCFAVLSYSLTKMYYVEEADRSMNNSGELITGLLDDHIRSIGSQLDIITENEHLKEFVSKMNADGGKDIFSSSNDPDIENALNMVCLGSKNIVSAWIVSDKSGILAGNNGRYMGKDEFALDSKQWYSKYISGSAKKYEYICTSPVKSLFDPEEEVVNIIVPAVSDGYAYAFCGIEVRTEEIFGILSEYDLTDECCPIISADGSIAYSASGTDTNGDPDLNDAPLSNLISSREYLVEGIDSFVSVRTI